MTALTDHGGRIDAAADLYPHAARPWLDLSTGINPVAWEPSADLAIDLRALPSPSALAALETVAADYFGTDPARVVALPGTEIGLRLLRDLGLPTPQRHVEPAYATHALAFDTAIGIPGQYIGTISDGTMLLANPNNPDGRIIPAADLLALARRGTTLVVDEAFADIDPTISLTSLSTDTQAPIVILRSFGKFFGLAGVRLGFAIGPAAIVARIRARIGCWPLSATAIAIGTAAYADTGWIAETRGQLPARAAVLDALLALHGLIARGDCPLFRLIETDRAAEMFDRLARAGILTRPFDYAPHWLRFGVPATASDLDRLDRALTHG